MTVFFGAGELSSCAKPDGFLEGVDEAFGIAILRALPQ
jgi:hypothetical protein